MEDILEVLVYLLFIVASVIGGLYRSYTKKKEEERRRQRIEMSQSKNQPEFNQSANEPEPFPSSFEELFKQQFKIEDEIQHDYGIDTTENNIRSTERVESITAEEGEAVFPETEEELLSDNLSDKDFSLAEEFQKQNHNIGEEAITKNTVDKGVEEDLSGEFDLRKAIIYSEIMNRPY